MADKYLVELSGVTGLPVYESAKVVGDKGTLISLRDGFLVSAGLGKDESGSSAVLVLYRFPHREDISALQDALKAAKGGFTEVKVDNSSALAVWKYTFGKPKAADVAEGITNLLTTLKQNAQPYDGRCEMCRGTSVSEITLMNDVPGYYCAACQEKTRAELGAAAEQYERMDTNLPQGLLYGTGAAAVGGVAWGGVAYLINYIFLYGAVIIGWVVGWAVHKGIGKINLAGKIMVGLLTLGSILFGDALYYTLSFMQEMNLSMGDAIGVVQQHFLELEAENFASVFFALIGAGIAVYSHQKPKFTAKFEPLGPPTSSGDAFGTSAGK